MGGVNCHITVLLEGSLGKTAPAVASFITVTTMKDVNRAGQRIIVCGDA